MCIKLEQSWLQQEWKFENWFANASHLHRIRVSTSFLLTFLRARQREKIWKEKIGKTAEWEN